LTTLQQLQDRIGDAALRKATLDIRGGHTKSFLGGAAQGEVFEVAGYQGIVNYEPTELVVTARCGTPLAQLEAALAEKAQCLPFEPPHFGKAATVGGMVAAGLAGPSRACAGGVRDYVLGAQMINGKAELLSFGGQVMKNVAGYDVSRVLAGSMGVLGVITEVSLKVLPIAPATLTLRFEMNEAQAIHSLNSWAGKPLPLNASCWLAGILHLRLRGAKPALQSAQQTLGGDAIRTDAEAAYWHALREQQHAFFALRPEQTLWRLSVPPTTLPLDVGDALIEWGGGQRWIKTASDDADAATTLRHAAAQAGGNAQRFRGANRYANALSTLAGANARIHERLKTAFDPHRLFNRGRLYASL
jgi:glycolate oxidase FAD binding subunit